MRNLKGKVISDKMKKTVVVQVDRLTKHPKYLKYYRVSRKFKAHDELGAYHVGDYVVISEARPLSKDKRWKVTKLIRRKEVHVDSDIVDIDNENKEETL